MFTNTVGHKTPNEVTTSASKTGVISMQWAPLPEPTTYFHRLNTRDSFTHYCFLQLSERIAASYFTEVSIVRSKIRCLQNFIQEAYSRTLPNFHLCTEEINQRIHNASYTLQSYIIWWHPLLTSTIHP